MKKDKKNWTQTKVFLSTLSKLNTIASMLHIKLGKKVNRQEVIEYLADNYK